MKLGCGKVLHSSIVHGGILWSSQKRRASSVIAWSLSSQALKSCHHGPNSHKSIMSDPMVSRAVPSQTECNMSGYSQLMCHPDKCRIATFGPMPDIRLFEFGRSGTYFSFTKDKQIPMHTCLITCEAQFLAAASISAWLWNAMFVTSNHGLEPSDPAKHRLQTMCGPSEPSLSSPPSNKIFVHPTTPS